jgi:hypothetical protein
MWFSLSLIFFAFLVRPALAQQSDICDLIDIPNCRGVTKQLRRNTFQTAPNTSTAANLNPSNVSYDRGFGIEGLVQANNPAFFSIVSGTGRMGGALISGALDNSFFGNRTPELDEDFLSRNKNDKQYRNKKLSLSLGGKVISQRKVGLDLGFIFKRHNEVKRINPGAGLSGRIYFLHFGASMYKDDYFLDLQRTFDSGSGLPYSTILGKNSLQESFQVTTYTVGTRIKNLSLDVANIRSKLDYYNEATSILIYSAAFNFNNFLLNVAFRKEHSGAPAYESNSLKTKTDKSDAFYALQYSLNRHFIFGVNYNFFLLKELSLSATIFI